jgi:preprotein translocase subunit SecG
LEPEACLPCSIRQVVIAFDVLLMLTSGFLILMILLHKGRGGGLSDMFGGGVSSGLGGSSVAEKNLDRITIGVAIVWVVCIIVLGLLLKS